MRSLHHSTRDWRDRAIYLVVRDFPTLAGRPRVVLEQDLGETSIDDVIATLADDPDDMVAVWEINPAEGYCRDVSEDIARVWLRRLQAGGRPSNGFIEHHFGVWA